MNRIALASVLGRQAEPAAKPGCAVALMAPARGGRYTRSLGIVALSFVFNTPYLESFMAEEKRTAAPDQMPVPVDESHILATYANFCRVTGTPEELIVDFGLNKQVGGNSPETIQLTQRIIVNFFTAKRLAAALVMAVQRHEQAFGMLETDVQKRVVPQTKA